MDTRTVLILEGATTNPVVAVLHLRMTADQVVRAEESWRAHRVSLGADSEHSHWNWERKVPELAVPGTRCIGIECTGLFQGMMIVREREYVARLDPDRGERILYVDFLEAAPWNVRR